MDLGSNSGSSPPTDHEISTKLPSSSYKGVVPQHNGRWGAQIYEHHRRIWLGTFSDEVAAARAYDVAAQRFRGRDAATNFLPLSTESEDSAASELAFLAAHSKTEIVDMLRKHTYYEELRNSRRNQMLGRNRRSGNTWSERKLLFYKIVTPSDVGKLNRLVIPKQHAEKHFPLRMDESNNNNNNNNNGDESNNSGVLLNFEDNEGKVWRFRYSYWNSSQSYVLTKGWSRFVKEKGLSPGDVVSFWRYFDGSDMNVMQLLIDCKSAPPGEVQDVAVASSDQVAVMESEDQDERNAVRLFGVNIGSSSTQNYQAGSSSKSNHDGS